MNPTVEFINKLQEITDTKIADLTSFRQAVKTRLDDFYRVGCRFTDHAIDNGFEYSDDDGKNEARFKALISSEISADDMRRLSSYILTFLATA